MTHCCFTMLRCLLTISCCILTLFLTPAHAADDTTQNPLPKPLETALGELLAATAQPKTSLSQRTMETILSAVASPLPSDASLSSTDHGHGAFHSERLKLPLHTLMQYLLNPNVPVETLFPASIRRGVWLQGSDVLQQGATLLNAPLPPATPLVLHGKEYEETTPDTSSGCYYGYTLDRLLILTSYQGRSALISVSLMPKTSNAGRKGAIVGKDNNWSYVYTPDVGTNINMLGWAETYLYGSASVSIFMEPEPASKQTELVVFKWAKGGWSGMNVIKRDHITEGLKRFTTNLRRVLESPRCPSPESIAAHFATLKQTDEATLRQQLAPFGIWLAAQGNDQKLLQEKSFKPLLEQGAYPATLKRDEVIAELMKLYMRQQLGTLPRDLAPSSKALSQNSVGKPQS